MIALSRLIVTLDDARWPEIVSVTDSFLQEGGIASVRMSVCPLAELHETFQAIFRTGRRAIAMMFVRSSVRLSV